MTVQKRAEIAKAGHHDIVRPVHAAIQQLEIVGENNKRFTPGFQRLPEQAFHLTVRTCGHLCVSQRTGAIMKNRHGILVYTFALNWFDKWSLWINSAIQSKDARIVAAIESDVIPGKRSKRVSVKAKTSSAKSIDMFSSS
jgi:hypothetical protein